MENAKFFQVILRQNLTNFKLKALMGRVKWYSSNLELLSIVMKKKGVKYSYSTSLKLLREYYFQTLTIRLLKMFVKESVWSNEYNI